jgi:hypothetical protein
LKTISLSRREHPFFGTTNQGQNERAWQLSPHWPSNFMNEPQGQKPKPKVSAEALIKEGERQFSSGVSAAA